MEGDFGEVLNAIPSIVFTVRADGHVDFVNGHWEEYRYQSVVHTIVQ